MTRKRGPCTEHKMSDTEFERLNFIMDVTAPLLVDTIERFMNGCAAAGIQKKVAGAAFSAFLMTNIAKTLAMASGMRLDEIDIERLRDISQDVCQSLSMQVGQYIMEENEKHVRGN